MSWRKPARVGSSACWRYSRATPTSSWRFSIRPRASIVRSASSASIVPDFSRTRSTSSSTGSSCAATMSVSISAWKARTARTEAAASPAASGSAIACEQRAPARLGVRHEPLERRVADPAPRPVRDAEQRAGVARVREDAQVRGRVPDLRALVEARPADDLVRHVLPDEHVLQHARLRVRPVEDRDLARRDAAVDERGDLGGDEARLGVLVLDLDDADGIALAEVGEELLRLALAVVLDDRVGRAEDRVRRAVVLLERDDPRAGEVALELHDVADVRAAERVDRLVRVADGADVPVLAAEELEQPVLRVVRVLVLVDEDVAERLLPARERLGEALEHLAP